jgi:hypothetical protein
MATETHRSPARRRRRAATLGLLTGLLPAAAQAAGTLHLERCVGNCVYQGNFSNNSCANLSSILTGTRTLTPFSHGDEAWQEVVDCVTAALAPFDVAVTDVNPGCAVPHWEVAVAGTPTEAGQSPSVAGVAPFSCGVIPNAPAFAFANIHDDMLALCWTVTHEFAHLLGADHELRAVDPMTYLPGCLPKRFSAAATDCGEGSARTCCTGSATQVSAGIVRAAVGDRAGGPIFPDGFDAWDEVGQGVVGSTCAWDFVEGVEPGLDGSELEPALRCGTAVDAR